MSAEHTEPIPMSIAQLILRIILCLSLISGLSGRAMATDSAPRATAACHTNAAGGHEGMAAHGMDMAAHGHKMHPMMHDNNAPCHKSADGGHQQKSGAFNCCTPQCQLNCDPNVNIAEVPRASQRFVMVTVPAHRTDALVDAPKTRILRPPIHA